MSFTSIQSGFADPVHQAQQTFRAVLAALARPGRAVGLSAAPAAADGLGPALRAALLTLADHETPVWWPAGGERAAAWLRFHNGAPAATARAQARFAVVADAARMPALADFDAGSAEAPEASTTLLIEVPSFDDGPAWRCSGPGIEADAVLRVAGLVPDFWTQWQANHARFPQGVDVIFCCGPRLVGLPRTTRVQSTGGGT